MKTLTEELQSIRTKVEANISKEAVSIMDNSVRIITELDWDSSVLKEGDMAPEFELQNQNGEIISSQRILSKGPLIVVFYFGTWCGYCNADLAYLKKIKEQVNDVNGTIVGISPQTVKNNLTIHSLQKLNFDVLYDKKNQIASDFGVKWVLNQELKDLYIDLGINLDNFNDDNSWSLPITSRFIIDQSGKIIYSDFRHDYRTRTPHSELLQALKNI